MLVCCYETKSIYIFERTLLLETAGLIVAAGYGSGDLSHRRGRHLHSSTEIAITVGAVSHTAAFRIKATYACVPELLRCQPEVTDVVSI